MTNQNEVREQVESILATREGRGGIGRLVLSKDPTIVDPLVDLLTQSEIRGAERLAEKAKQLLIKHELILKHPSYGSDFLIDLDTALAEMKGESREM